MKAKTDDECGRLHIVCDGLLRAYSCAGIISVILRQHTPIMHTCAGETVYFFDSTHTYHAHLSR